MAGCLHLTWITSQLNSHYFYEILDTFTREAIKKNLHMENATNTKKLNLQTAKWFAQNQVAAVAHDFFMCENILKSSHATVFTSLYILNLIHL